ncbi:MAG: hypothetical protein C4516_08770 [Oxalobacter sp.]|nr:MAG: hypothetical protein C4516_08770 [Oxalobacter sp.]
MDSILEFYKKNTAAAIIVGLLFPIGLALLYGGGKSIWVRQRNKKERAAIYNLLLNSKATDKAMTNDEIIKATGIPRDRVVGHCEDHPEIKDAGKRKRSWRLKRDDEGDDDE